MATINRTQFRKQLEPGLNTIFGLAYEDYREEWRDVFDIERSERSFEEDQLVSGFGAAPVKAEGAGVLYDTAAEVWTARYIMETIALAFSITAEAIADNLYGDIGAKYTKALARSLMHTKELKGANVLNNAFTAAFSGGDGKELCATDHPLAGGGTLANELATPADLSETALEDMIIGIAGFVDERGLPINVMPRKLIVPKEEMFNADRILLSTGRPGTNDNDRNAIFHMGMFPDGYTVNHRLTDTDAFFIKTDCPDGLKHFQRQAVETYTEGEFNTGNTRYKAVERYVFGWTDPRGIYGSAGESS